MITFWIRTMLLMSLILGNNIQAMGEGNQGRPPDTTFIELDEIVLEETTQKPNRDTIPPRTITLKKNKKTNYLKLLLSAGIGFLLASSARDILSAVTTSNIDEINALASPITAYPCDLWDMGGTGNEVKYDNTTFYFPAVEKKPDCTYEEHISFLFFGDKEIPNYAKGSSLCVEDHCCSLIEDCDGPNGEYKTTFAQSKKSAVASLGIGISLTIITSATHLFCIFKDYCFSPLQT